MHSDRPQLFVVGGPNGAGKSTTSESLLEPYDLKAFDWDKEFYQKWSVFNYDALVEQGVRETTNERFEHLRKESIKNSRPFAFETNFHSIAILRIIEEFQKTGFETNLYFLLISSVEVCKQRVSYRVKEEQGHYVSTATIENRFEQGLNLLDRAFHHFDRAFLLNASYDHRAELIATFRKGILQDKYHDLPKTIESKISRISQLLYEKK